eukprot:gene37799-46637_t
MPVERELFQEVLCYWYSFEVVFNSNWWDCIGLCTNSLNLCRWYDFVL